VGLGKISHLNGFSRVGLIFVSFHQGKEKEKFELLLFILLLLFNCYKMVIRIHQLPFRLPDHDDTLKQ